MMYVGDELTAVSSTVWRRIAECFAHSRGNPPGGVMAAQRALQNVKLKHWCGFHGVFGLEAAPVLEFLIIIEAARRIAHRRNNLLSHSIHPIFY